MTHLGRLILAAGIALTLCASALAQSGVTIEVDQFGVGNSYRQGELTGIRLKLTSALDQPTPVWVQWQVPNVDGDIGEYGRSLTLTPNQQAFTWLYAPLPPDVNNSAVWTVRVFEERDGQRGAEVGGARISPSATGASMVEIVTGMIAVVGQDRLGLDAYSNPTPGASRTLRPVGGHEDTRIISGIRTAQLPDRWFGLLPFEALAWAGDNMPQGLGVDQAEAIREYIRRGGHLIISLPNAGNPWGLGAMGQTELDDLLPCRTPGSVPRRDEAVPLAALLPVISKFNTVTSLTGTREPPQFSVRVFKDLLPLPQGDEQDTRFNVIDNHYEPLIAMPDGRVIVIQRRFGHGRITIIGLDLTAMRGLPLPQADAFWNRVLGRRMDTPSAGELRLLGEQERLNRVDLSHENSLGAGATVTGIINMEGQAGKGLLLALLLFAVYWLVAGPLGFAVMKHYGYIRHSWLGFAACAALFTAIAWGGVNLFPKRVEISHLTFLDHIARPPDDLRPNDPQYQRAISYFSAYVPRYGNTPVSIDSTDEQRDLLMSWAAPSVVAHKFPDVDRFRVDVARGSASLAIPARSTASQLYAHWLGGLDAEWGGTLRVDPQNPIRVIEGEQSLRGRIINECPNALKNVTVIWVKNRRYERPRYFFSEGKDEPRTWFSGSPLNIADVWRVGEWPAGAAEDLATLGAGDARLSIINAITRRYIEPYSKPGFADLATSGSVNETDRRPYLEILSIFNQINPPEYLKNPTDQLARDAVAFQRQMAREADLSGWFNRPCLIVIGFLENAPNPVPVRIDDEDNLPVSRSLTVVRWIYPLPLDEEAAFDQIFRPTN